MEKDSGKIELSVYSTNKCGKVHDFLRSVFQEAGKTFEPDGRHAAFNDIERNFIGFWCLMLDNEVVGTVAVKKLSETVCELKCLYVYERYHGRRLGYKLAETAVDFAKEMGFAKIVLDTMLKHDKALKLYEKMGFRRCERYNDNEMAEIFMELSI
ncbi:MAG: GNAT family N-acetyltransferase [Ruminococcus sp.]|uniref:GNAT family N-acetyltransferase n=1 Tax=Ruminococcus sp. TaxID=41978 RepID=UPI0025DB38A1|nr:GNAT family N-acetyltransferase [Ruminococcus sp.]MCR5599248.1 GNAT family N-acetyltransferase [Ruminococcus sp.]